MLKRDLNSVGIKSNWFKQQVRKAELATAKVSAGTINKASEKFNSLSIKKQCETYLPMITMAKFAGQNIHRSFLDGMKSDYNEANNESPVSISDWLKPYYEEPLFLKVLKKCKTTKEELEETLKGETYES